MKSLVTLILLTLFSFSLTFAQLNYGESTFGIYGVSFSLGFGGGEVDLGGNIIVRTPEFIGGNPMDTQIGGVLGWDSKFKFNGARATAGFTSQVEGGGVGTGLSLHIHYVQEVGKEAYVPLTLGVHPGLIGRNTYTGRVSYSFMLWNGYEYDDSDQGLWRKDNFDIRPGLDVGGGVALSFGEGLITPVAVFDANILHLNVARTKTGELLPTKLRTALHLRAGYVTTF
ncbi:MAG: hypothetical protein MRZ79_23150 [Bacteroidia bacterium]|nr:hypothetical protein [Bacteroidia bacterium]